MYCTRTFVRFVLSYFRKYFRTFVRKYFRTKYFRTCTCTRVQLYSVHRIRVYNLWNIYRRYLVSPKIFYLRARRAYCTQLHIGFFTYSIVFYFRKYVYCTCTTTCTFVQLTIDWTFINNLQYSTCTTYNYCTTLFIRVEILER